MYKRKIDILIGKIVEDFNNPNYKNCIGIKEKCDKCLVFLNNVRKNKMHGKVILENLNGIANHHLDNKEKQYYSSVHIKNTDPIYMVV